MNRFIMTAIGLFFSAIVVLSYTGWVCAKDQVADDEKKMQQAIEIFENFRKQSDTIDRARLSSRNYYSLYRSNLRNALMWSATLADFGDCTRKVDQYNTHMKFKYKKKNQFTPEKEMQIDEWSSDILTRCGDHEKDLLGFIDNALDTCHDALEKYAFNNPTAMEKNNLIREDMQNFVGLDNYYQKMKEKAQTLQEYYPEVYTKLNIEVNRWLLVAPKDISQSKLPAMKE